MRCRQQFEAELLRMAAFPVRHLVLATTWGEIKSGGWRAEVTPASVRGSLLSWSVRYGIPIWPAGTPEACAELVREILYRAAKDWWRQARIFAGTVLEGGTE